jgi:hypothetical protein
MMGTDIRGPGLLAMDGAADLQPGMAEGKAFVTRDRAATDRLTTFLQDVEIGCNAYTNTAKDSGHDYLASDDASAELVSQVTKNIYK